MLNSLTLLSTGVVSSSYKVRTIALICLAWSYPGNIIIGISPYFFSSICEKSKKVKIIEKNIAKTENNC